MTRINTEGNAVQTITVLPGQSVALATGRDLRIKGISGTAYITHTGRDLFLWRGDSLRIAAANARIWGAPVLSALGDKPATITVETEQVANVWQFWTRNNQPVTPEPVTTFWTRLRVRFGNKRTPAHRTCRSTIC